MGAIDLMTIEGELRAPVATAQLVRHACAGAYAFRRATGETPGQYRQQLQRLH